MGIEMIQCAISFLTSMPSTLIHALDLFVTSARTFVLLGTRNWDEGVDLRQMMLSVNCQQLFSFGETTPRTLERLLKNV
jgi:hypothetical protein